MESNTPSNKYKKFSDKFSPNLIYTIISIASWLLFLSLSWMSFWIPKVEVGFCKTYVFWLNFIYRTNTPIVLSPIYINYVLFYMIVALTIGLSTIAFFIYIYYLFFAKDVNVKNGMLGEITRYHCVPLIGMSILYIIGVSLGKNLDFQQIHLFSNLIFSVISLGSILFITFNTKMESPAYALTINKGAYSCLIGLLVYNFFYSFWFYGSYLIKDSKNWDYGCNIAFALLIGIANNGLALLLKDIVLAFVNILIYIGMIVNFFKLTKYDIEVDYNGNYFGGIIEIIILLGSIALISFLLFKYKSVFILFIIYNLFMSMIKKK